MVEAAIQIKLHPSSILDMYKVFEHINMLSMGIWKQPYTIILVKLNQIWDFWDAYGVEKNDAITSWLRLQSYSNCFLHPY